MSDDSELLFYQSCLDETLRNVNTKAVEEVNALDSSYLMKVSEEDLIDSLAAKHQVEPIELIREQIVVDGPREVEITYRGEMAFAYGEDQVTVRGTALTIVVPFRGDPMLFKLRPSTWNTNPPRGRVVDHELHLDFRGEEMSGEQLKREYERVLADAEEYVSWQRGTIDAHNHAMRQVMTQAVAQRKAKLKKDMDLVAGLDIPVRRRSVPGTFTVPQVRRKPRIELPNVSAGPYKPEPVLADDHYEFVLRVIQDMALVMERSPKAFAKMEEEHLRHHFLVQLNGHFEGGATGETFNYKGKTDILIRHEGRNVFIAECKFWRGDKAFSEAIDQLLGYSSWRDTKTGLILFNQNRNFSGVLTKIPQLVKTHPNHKRELSIDGETRFRHVLHHCDDKNRELVLTVLAFDVPTRTHEEVPGDEPEA